MPVRTLDINGNVHCKLIFLFSSFILFVVNYKFDNHYS